MKKKTKKKIKKAIKKMSFTLKLFCVLIILAVLVAFIYVGYGSYQNSLLIQDEVEVIRSDFYLETPSQTEKNFIVKEYNLDKYEITYHSSNTNYLTTDGIITRPVFSIGDIEVVFTINIKVKTINTVDTFLFGFLGVDTEYSYSRKVVIKSLDMTDTDKVELASLNFYLPDTIYASIGLPKDNVYYEGVKITYRSSDENILTNNGIKVGSGEVSLTVSFTCNNIVKNKQYVINCLDYLIVDEVNTDFYNFEKSSYKNVTYYQGLELGNCLSDNEALKFKPENELAYIKTIYIKRLKSISFTYEYYESSKGNNYTKNTYITLKFSTDGITYDVIKEVILDNSNLNTFNFDFNLDNGYIQILITTEYAEKYVLIDDFLIQRELTTDDISDAFLNTFPNSFASDFNLPRTTVYGGVVSYISMSPNFADGKVERLNESIEVELIIYINGFYEEIVISKIVTIRGLEEVVNVEIRFIDVGKYGDNDCGEAIYIKYGDIDILIDAGDDFKPTVRQVLEVINEFSNDNVLDYLIATHPDSDHIGGMNEVLEALDVLNVIRFSGDASSKKIYPEFNEAVINEECTVCNIEDSVNNLNGCTQIITLSDDVYIEFINTTYLDSTDNNSRSIVLVLNAYGVRTLFTGDGDNNKYQLEDAYKDIVSNIDILKVVHHGSRNGTTLDFLKVVDPEVAIITNGNYFGNRHGHPTFEAISTLYEYDPNMLVYAVVGGDSESCELTSSIKCDVTDRFVDRNGTILITIDNSGYVITSEYYFDNPIEVKDTTFWEVVQGLIN